MTKKKTQKQPEIAIPGEMMAEIERQAARYGITPQQLVTGVLFAALTRNDKLKFGGKS